MAIDLGKIKLFLGPRDIDPAGSNSSLDDLEITIIDFIDGAKKYLDIAVQELDSLPIAQVIVRAQLRGIRVRLVSEADYLIDKRASKTHLCRMKNSITRPIA